VKVFVDSLIKILKCYLSIRQVLILIFKLTGFLIRRFDFSDAQSSKGSCDTMTAITKGYIRRFINEKHDCINSFDFVNATRSTPSIARVDII